MIVSYSDYTDFCEKSGEQPEPYINFRRWFNGCFITAAEALKHNEYKCDKCYDPEDLEYYFDVGFERPESMKEYNANLRHCIDKAFAFLTEGGY